MEYRTRIPVLIAFTIAATGALPAAARVHERREATLERIFGPGATFEPRTAYLTVAQVESARALGQAPIEAARFTYWVATAGTRPLGRAFLDTHIVRTMPATFLVAVDPEDRVICVDVLAFAEPEDYLPPRRWLDRLAGRTLSAHLRPGDAVDGITGATLSARAVAESVRRCLALARIVTLAPMPAPAAPSNR